MMDIFAHESEIDENRSFKQRRRASQRRGGRPLSITDIVMVRFWLDKDVRDETVPHLDKLGNFSDRDSLSFVSEREPSQLRVVGEFLNAQRSSRLDERDDLLTCSHETDEIRFKLQQSEEEEKKRRESLPFLAN